MYNNIQVREESHSVASIFYAFWSRYMRIPIYSWHGFPHSIHLGLLWYYRTYHIVFYTFNDIIGCGNAWLLTLVITLSHNKLVELCINCSQYYWYIINGNTKLQKFRRYDLFIFLTKVIGTKAKQIADISFASLILQTL